MGLAPYRYATLPQLCKPCGFHCGKSPCQVGVLAIQGTTPSLTALAWNPHPAPSWLLAGQGSQTGTEPQL